MYINERKIIISYSNNHSIHLSSPLSLTLPLIDSYSDGINIKRIDFHIQLTFDISRFDVDTLTFNTVEMVQIFKKIYISY